jgi:hypothetical protein
MDTEERERLEHIEEVSEENQELLEKLYRIEKRRRIFRIAYWTIIIAFSLGSYYLIQPYLEMFKQVTGTDFDVGSFIKLPGGGK